MLFETHENKKKNLYQSTLNQHENLWVCTVLKNTQQTLQKTYVVNANPTVDRERLGKLFVILGKELSYIYIVHSNSQPQMKKKKYIYIYI